MAELEQEPDYQARRRALDAEVAVEAERRLAAQQPVIQELRSVGVDVTDTYELYEHQESYPRAIPVLLRHLGRDYPDEVLRDIGDGLPFKPDPVWWEDFKKLYTTTTSDAVRDRLAAAMGGCARRAHYDDLLAFVQNPDLGSSRIYLLRPLNRIGNHARSGRGREVIKTLSAHPVLGPEARAILKGRSRNQ